MPGFAVFIVTAEHDPELRQEHGKRARPMPKTQVEGDGVKISCRLHHRGWADPTGKDFGNSV